MTSRIDLLPQVQIRRQRIEKMLELAKIDKLTKPEEIDQLVLKIMPYVSRQTRQDYRNTVIILLGLDGGESKTD